MGATTCVRCSKRRTEVKTAQSISNRSQSFALPSRRPKLCRGGGEGGAWQIRESEQRSGGVGGGGGSEAAAQGCVHSIPN